MLHRPRILVVGSFMMDLIATTKVAPKPGETVTGLNFRTAPGGKGANQAVQCARLGAHVVIAGRVGNDAFGSLMLQTLSDAGVDISHVSRDQVEPSGIGHITLEVSERGVQNRITVCPGANHTLTVDDICWIQDEIENFDILMLQFELPMEINEAAARWAHEAGVPVMINPAPSAPISDELMSCATYLSPNEHEAAAISGHRINVSDGINFEDIQAVADYFRAKGAKNLIITLGENGSVIAGAEGLHHVPCVHMPYVADPTAAGDSFVAAFCTGHTAGLSQEYALAFASHSAAITVSRMGAMPSLPTITEVQALLRERNDGGFDPSILDALK